jgi:hypothetical protein
MSTVMCDGSLCRTVLFAQCADKQGMIGWRAPMRCHLLDWDSGQK